MKQKNISILALLLMAVTGAWAQGSGGDHWGPVQTSSAAWTALTEGSTTGMTLGAADATTYYYMTENLTFSNNTAGGSGLTIQGTVYIYIPSGVTLTATGADGEGTTGGGAGILVPSGTTLNIFGEGTIVATGGNAANGGNGGNGTAASFVSPYYYAGLGGAGGNGGGGAGAGIGTAGGNGGNGAAQLAEASRPKANTEEEEWKGELSGLIGTNGTDGATAAAVGTVNIASSIDKTHIAGGAKGDGGAAGLHGGYIFYGDGDVYSYSADDDSQIELPTFETVTYAVAVAGGGGGGGGAGGGSAQAIGTGGAGGGGGASGACGSGWAADSWVNDYWTSVGAGGGAGGIGTEGNDGAKGYTCYFQGEDDAEFDEDDNHKPGGVGGSAGAASATKTAGTAAAPTYTITYFKAEGATLSKTSETYTFGSDTEISLPTITSTDGKDYKWMLSKYGRAFGETTSPCAGLNGTIYNSGDDISLSNVYGDLEFTTVYIGWQIDCRSQTESTLTPFDPDKYAVVNLKNRKLYKDGYWNTLTLPFNLSTEKLATTCLAGADIRTFESASVDGDKLTINFSGSNLGEIEAGVPYIIRWGTPETATGEVIENPSFTNVEVAITSQEDIDDEEYGTETASNGLRFEAQIGPVQLTSGSKALVLGNENKLYKPKYELYVYATRAYFSYSGNISMARQIVMDFGDGDQQTTYIDGITVDGNRGSSAEGIFNLNGQRLSAPQKGINIVNGKKVLVGDKR
ncbi:MAG: hypothetical protein IJ559_01665 [Prevotella sp.]|nr:hypothetical protein [Prevotella sp.]